MACCLDAHRIPEDSGLPRLYPGALPLNETAAAWWSVCEAQASSRNGVAARHSKPESLEGSRIIIWLDALSSPPTVGFALEGQSIGSVELSDALLEGPRISPSLQLECDDLCALHIVPCQGSLKKDQLETIGTYLSDLPDIQAMWPITIQKLALHASAQLTEDVVTKAGENAAWAVFGGEGADHLPVRSEHELFDKFVMRVMELILKTDSTD
eukprot:TRINITY_DN69020_c0_g1_i1.p1 TRINITY_DN69020_c0_g1~~TRINITY_DN69020_c0_g1_i1.p1  ORF type:complete len:212 (-),score=29.47 TRINITY_DN69020_c0_g1_i1:208-843(-)